MKPHYFIQFRSPFKYILVLFILLFLRFTGIQAQDSLLSVEIIYRGLTHPTSLYVTRNHIYIVDQKEDQLIKLDLYGNEKDRIGGSGSGDYQFSLPVDVDATNGLKIYISDYNNRRIQVFDRRGQYLSSLDATQFNGEQIGRRFTPTQLAVNDVGELYFYNESDKTIRKYGFNGNFEASYPLPRSIEQVDDIIFHERIFYVLDKKEEVIHLLTENWIPEGFYPAEKTMAVAVSGGDIWHIKKDKIYFDGRENVLEYNWKPHFEAVDAQVLGNLLFILDKRNVYKISIPE